MASSKSIAPEQKITGTQIANAVSASDKDISFAEFNNPSIGENFGGSFPPLELEVNSVSPRLIYIKDSKVVLEKTVNGEKIADIKKVAVVAHKSDPNKMFGLPISAIFEKNWKESDLNIGSEIVVARFADSTKKRGEGAGQKMKNYALKVLVRANKAE